jgi:hypothetical protein
MRNPVYPKIRIRLTMSRIRNIVFSQLFFSFLKWTGEWSRVVEHHNIVYLYFGHNDLLILVCKYANS